jgi:hypothetical protein
VAALFLDMVGKFYLLKNYKINDNSTTTETREKIHSFEILIILENFDVGLT